MFRMWGKIFHENHMLKDTVICIDSDLNRTRKVYQALEEICYEFDLSKPLWLDHNKNDFIHHSKTRFNSDSFVEDIDFDFRGRKEYRRSEVLHQEPEGSPHSFSRKYGKNREIRSAFRFLCQNVHKVCLQTGRSGCQSPVPAG